MAQKTSVDNIRLLQQIIETQGILASADFDVQAFMQLVANEVQELTPATGAVVELVEGAYMVYEAVTGTVSDYHGLRLPLENSISGRCILENRVLISPDTEKDPRVNVDACRKVQARSLIVAPLVYAGKPVGVLKILSKHPEAFTALHIHILELMASFIAAGLKHQILFQEKEVLIKKLEKTQARLSHMARHDVLTKLPNRSFFDTFLKNTMERIRRHGGLMALMFLDLDHFKQINDELGHNIGDTVLVKFAALLKKSVRRYDGVFRLGGDEFVIIFDNLKRTEDAEKVAEKIVKKMQGNTDFVYAGFTVSTSIGIAFYRGEPLTATALIKQADDALYAVKIRGRNGFDVFAEGLWA